MQKYIVDLKNISAKDSGLVGNKSVNLSKMLKAGLTIPPGFCITTKCYEIYKKEKSLPAKIKKIITKHLEKLKENNENITFAVRSSATAEDTSSLSFAGQYETYLNVNEKNIFSYIEKCFSSLFAERAVKYRKDKQVKNIKMAVIVQEMIKSEISGVMFTANPLDGNTNKIIVEATFGLAYGIVSGEVATDRYIVDKTTKKIKKNINKKEFIFECGEKNEIIKLKVAEEKINSPALTNKHLKSLVKKGIKLEKQFNSPQDIEWTIADNKIYILQTRPITALPTKEKIIWSSANAQEAFPGVITPFSWSMISIMVTEQFYKFFKMSGVKDVKNIKYVKQFSGRAYLNFTALKKLAEEKMGLPKNLVNLLLGGGENKKIVFSFNFSLLKMLPNMLMLKVSPQNINLIGKTKQAIKIYLKNLKNVKKINYAEKNIKQLFLLFTKQTKTSIIEYHFKCSGNAFVLYAVLAWFCNKWCKNLSPQKLMTGLTGMKDTEPSAELFKLSLAVKENEKLINIFLNKLNNFKEKYGHISSQGTELFNKRWAEDEEFIYNNIKNYIKLKNYEGILFFEDRQKKVREAETQKAKQKLPLVKWIIFNKVLTLAQQYELLRENLRFEISKTIFETRKIILVIGKKLVAKNILNNPDDIFMLTIEELKDIVDKRFNEQEIKQKITARWLEYEKFKTIHPPTTICEGEILAEEIIEKNINMLQGIGVATGKVTGKAKIINSPTEITDFNKGDILVAPYTDPGWTPLFILASALVTDIGGMLSHGSIVAREYGIPAVVNVSNATAIIKNEQVITVDGDEGKVFIKL